MSLFLCPMSLVFNSDHVFIFLEQIGNNRLPEIPRVPAVARLLKLETAR